MDPASITNHILRPTQNRKSNYGTARPSYWRTQVQSFTERFYYQGKKKVYKSYIECQERILSCVVWFHIVKPRFTNTRLIRTPHYYGQFALSLKKKNSNISLNLTRLIQTLSMVSSLSRINGVLLYFILHIVPVRWLCRGSKHLETPLYNMTPWIIPVFWHFASSWLYHQVDLITCTVRDITRTSNCGIRVINWFHCQPFYEKKKKETRPSPLLFAQLLATERGRQLTKARANKATGLTNGRAATCAQEVTCSPFCALFRRQLTFPFYC